MDFSSLDAAFKTVLNFNVILGMFLYFISMLLFFYLLSNFRLSIVIPVTGLTYVLNLLAAYAIFHEKISAFQLLGMILVLAGILMVSYNGSSVQ
jgi:drug/metabolite transporter (DMT)-like permease